MRGAIDNVRKTVNLGFYLANRFAPKKFTQESFFASLLVLKALLENIHDSAEVLLD
jgi:hypothetical protein